MTFQSKPRLLSALLIALMCLGAGCSPTSIEDFHCEGEAQCRALIETMRSIDSREELAYAKPRLKKHFEKLVDLMIDAREFQEIHAQDPLEISYPSENKMSALLKEELQRIYTIEGGKEIIEHSQKEALVRLDAFERARTKKRQALRK
jgi:hypothetical protein